MRHPIPALAIASLCLVATVLAASPVAAAAPATPCSLFGTAVGVGDADLSAPLVVGPLSTRFLDGNGDGLFTPGEAVYVDSVPAGLASYSDVRLTGAPGSFVSPGDADDGALLLPLGGAFAFVDFNGNGVYDLGDLVYHDTDGSSTVTVADLRLTSTPGGAAGTEVASGAVDLGFPLAAFGSASLSFLDADGNGFFSRVDALYLHVGSGSNVQVNDLRLSGRATAIDAQPAIHVAPVPLGVLAPAFRATLHTSFGPVPGAPLAFYVGGDLACTAPTDASGTAACGGTEAKVLALAAGGYTVRFAGGFPHCASEAAGSIL